MPDGARERAAQVQGRVQGSVLSGGMLSGVWRVERDRDLAEQHYDEHRDKPFFGELVDFVTRSPVFPMVVEGPDENTYVLVRKLVGATKVTDAEPGTIRGDFATITTENLVHASDGHDSAAREIGLWFPGLT